MTATPNLALQRTAASRRGCNRRAPWPPSLSLGRSAAKTVAHKTPMVAIQPQSDAPPSDAPQPKSRWFRFTWLKLLLLILLLAASGVGLVVWSTDLPLYSTADYDKERYRQIYFSIAADPKHFRGKYFDDAIKALRLDDVPWDDITLQRSEGMDRIYHFRGFALHISLETLPRSITPPKNYRAVTSNGKYPPIIGVLRLRYQPHVEIDGLNDRQQRMKLFWDKIRDESDRINEELERERQQSQKKT